MWYKELSIDKHEKNVQNKCWAQLAAVQKEVGNEGHRTQRNMERQINRNSNI